MPKRNRQSSLRRVVVRRKPVENLPLTHETVAALIKAATDPLREEIEKLHTRAATAELKFGLAKDALQSVAASSDSTKERLTELVENLAVAMEGGRPVTRQSIYEVMPEQMRDLHDALLHGLSRNSVTGRTPIPRQAGHRSTSVPLQADFGEIELRALSSLLAGMRDGLQASSEEDDIVENVSSGDDTDFSEYE